MSRHIEYYYYVLSDQFTASWQTVCKHLVLVVDIIDDDQTS